MVSRIEVIPSEVRGYGNIVEAKSLSDFVPVESDLVYSENVYSLTAVSGVHISLTASSSSINVGSSVTLTATVMEDDTPVTGETVSFYDGETLLGSDSTDSSGVATYSASALTVGSHSLSAVYGEKTSNLVNVTVNKITPTITLSVPSSGTVGTSYNVTGTLSVDGSVKLYENSVLKDTLTVSSGSFSKAVTQNSEGTYSYYAVFEGSSTYESVTSSTGSIVVSDVPTPSYDGITLTGNKNILSAADSEYVTLEAQLTDGGSAASVSGETVTFTVYKDSDDSVVDILTADTNSSGLATVSYYGQGTGDLYIKAECTFVSEIYSIEDCYLNDTGSADKSSKFATNNVTLTHNTDHYEATTSVENGTVTLFENVDNYVATFDMKSSETGLGFGVFNSTSNYYNAFYCKIWGTTTQIYTSNATGTESNKKTVNHSRQNDWYNMTVRREGNSVTITMKRNGSQIFTYTQSISTGLNLGMINAYANRTFSFKNVKVKAL